MSAVFGGVRGLVEEGGVEGAPHYRLSRRCVKNIFKLHAGTDNLLILCNWMLSRVNMQGVIKWKCRVVKGRLYDTGSLYFYRAAPIEPIVSSFHRLGKDFLYRRQLKHEFCQGTIWGQLYSLVFCWPAE